MSVFCSAEVIYICISKNRSIAPPSSACSISNCDRRFTNHSNERWSRFIQKKSTCQDQKPILRRQITSLATSAYSKTAKTATMHSTIIYYVSKPPLLAYFYSFFHRTPSFCTRKVFDFYLYRLSVNYAPSNYPDFISFFIIGACFIGWRDI